MRSKIFGHDVVLPLVLVAGFVAACSAPRPASTATTASTLTSTNAETPPAIASTECELVCETAQITPRPSDSPDYHAQAVANADRVFATMRDDFLACYKGRLRAAPNAHGFITVDVLVGPDGRVLSVDTTGGALLGERAMACIVDRIKAATFEPVHGGGTRRIHVPFSLRRVGADEAI
jgi:hypothetical protein